MMNEAHVEYPKKTNPTHWDTLNVQYPVRKDIVTGESSKTLCHQWKGQTEVLREPKALYPEIKEYSRDFNVTKQLTRSETTLDFGFKLPETWRHNKHTSCTEQHYNYPLPRQLLERVPAETAHGTTEMRSSYKQPTIAPRLVTDKDHFKHPASLPLDPPPIECTWHKDVEPLDTTHEGYEKYLDPYLTTSRLHHRPYTAVQLSKPSVAKDIVTFYTFHDTPWIHTRKPTAGDWWLPKSRPKCVYDREKFKEGLREIRTHNKPLWIPGAFRTEVRDNFSKHLSQIQKFDDIVRNDYLKCVANLPTNSAKEDLLLTNYCTENNHVGSGRPICSVIDNYKEKNKRLELKGKKWK